MPLLIILGILIIYFLVRLYESDAQKRAETIVITLGIILLIAILYFMVKFPTVALILFSVALIAFVVVLCISAKKTKSNSQKVSNDIMESLPTMEEKNCEPLTENENVHFTSDNVKPTSFQNNLKKSFRTENEISEEIRLKTHEQAVMETKATVESIRNTLLNHSNQGTYIEKDGRKYVTCVTFLPYKYMKKATVNQKKELSEQLRKMMLGNSESRNQQLIKQYHPIIKNAPGCETTFSISSDNSYEYEVFIEELQNKATNDGIRVTPIIYNNSTHAEYTIPHIVKDEDCQGLLFSLPDTTQENCSLAVKCYCEVPDKYSSDVPIMVHVSNIDKTDETINKAEISIDTMDGYTFESFCADLLARNGFSNVAVTQGSGDQGIDIIAYKDDIKYGIQCKCYHSDIGNKAVQEAYSGKTFYGCHIGVVLTNMHFTRSAMDLAQSNGILLWDREKLLHFISCAES